ncbi:MAG: acylneuraminate cytidylyltransferase family protein [Candidatus Omnitrophota bacterium]
MLVTAGNRQQVITVIPARGGSKGIKKKNISLLGGKPLLSYSIEYSLRCPLVNRTIVSTDDLEIADIARKYGAEVPFIRPAEYAQDDTPDYPVYRHALEWLEQQEHKIYDIFILLRPTSPLRPKGLIEKGLELLVRNPHADSVRTVVLCSQHPYRMFKIEGDFLSPVLSNGVFEPYNIPRQKLPSVYFQTGDLEMIRRDTILKSNSISGKHIMPLIIKTVDIVDIDSETDLLNASRKFKDGDIR